MSRKTKAAIRKAPRLGTIAKPMTNTERLINRLRRDRPMVAVTLRMPKDVLDDLKRIAPLLGYSGYQPLMRAYVGRGLRNDLERLEDSGIDALVASLRRRGIDEALLSKALSEVSAK